MIALKMYAKNKWQMDTGYFLKAFAASPKAVVPGYVLGGVSYFSIPWCLGTVVGMASLGLEALPVFPTYPRVSLQYWSNGKTFRG